jgi:hypothetical protein
MSGRKVRNAQYKDPGGETAQIALPVLSNEEVRELINGSKCNTI